MVFFRRVLLEVVLFTVVFAACAMDEEVDLTHVSYTEIPIVMILDQEGDGIAMSNTTPLQSAQPRASTYQGTGQTSCCICLADFFPKDARTELQQCKHVFHTSCINDWLDTKMECPICRMPALTSDREGKNVLQECICLPISLVGRFFRNVGAGMQVACYLLRRAFTSRSYSREGDIT